MKIYQNSEIIMPVVIGTKKNSHEIMLKIPSLKSTTEKNWVFDDYEYGDEWKWNIVFAFNPNLLYMGIPRGCHFYRFKINKQFGYLETAVMFTRNISDDDDVRFITYAYNFPEAVPLFLWEELSYLGERKMYGLFNPKDLKTVYNEVNTPYRNYVLYFLPSSYIDKWKATTEYLCIPQYSKNDLMDDMYADYWSCASSTFSKIKNKKVWVENSSEPLYQYAKWWNTLSYDEQKNSLTPDKNSPIIKSKWIILIIMIILFIKIIFYKKLI